LFRDCDSGAVPALANAYDLPVIWDDRLLKVADIYIEAGDHEHLVHLLGRDFREMMEMLPHSMISRSAEMMAADDSRAR
jgi:Ala-tRNA(Pro) deacylase